LIAQIVTGEQTYVDAAFLDPDRFLVAADSLER